MLPSIVPISTITDVTPDFGHQFGGVYEFVISWKSAVEVLALYLQYASKISRLQIFIPTWPDDKVTESE